MSISELGAIGEFVSSLAIVVALVGIFYQIRQSNASEQSQVFATAAAMLTPLRIAVLGDRELAELLMRAQTEPDSLDETDMLRASLAIGQNFWTHYALYTQTRRGSFAGFDEEHWKHHLRADLSSELARRVWNQERFRFGNTPFSAMVDELVAEMEAPHQTT